MQDGSQNHEAYLLFPVHLDGTLQDVTKSMQEKKEYLSTITILQIFRQVNTYYVLLSCVQYDIVSLLDNYSRGAMVVRHTMLEQLDMTEMAHNLLLLFPYFFLSL